LFRIKLLRESKVLSSNNYLIITYAKDQRGLRRRSTQYTQRLQDTRETFKPREGTERINQGLPETDGRDRTVEGRNRAVKEGKDMKAIPIILILLLLMTTATAAIRLPYDTKGNPLVVKGFVGNLSDDGLTFIAWQESGNYSVVVALTRNGTITETRAMRANSNGMAIFNDFNSTLRYENASI